MATKLEDLFKTLRRGRAPSLGFGHSEAAGGERMIVAAIVDSPTPSAISSAVSAGAGMVLIAGDSSIGSRAKAKLVKAAGDTLIGVIAPDLTNEPATALARLSKLGVGFVIVDPDQAPARVLAGEEPEVVVRLELGDAQPPPARLTTELAVGGAAVSLLKRADAGDSLSLTDLALLKQFCSNSRRPVIFMAHAGVRPDDVQLLHDHGVECIAVEAGSVASYVEAVGGIDRSSARRDRDDVAALLPRSDGAGADE